MKNKDLEMGITWMFCKSDLPCWYIVATQSNDSGTLANIAHNSYSRRFCCFFFFLKPGRCPESSAVASDSVTSPTEGCVIIISVTVIVPWSHLRLVSFPPEDVSEHLAWFRFLVPCHLTAPLWWLLGPPTPLQTPPCFYTYALWFLTARPEDFRH